MGALRLPLALRRHSVHHTMMMSASRLPTDTSKFYGDICMHACMHACECLPQACQHPFMTKRGVLLLGAVFDHPCFMHMHMHGIRNSALLPPTHLQCTWKLVLAVHAQDTLERYACKANIRLSLNY